jgi:multidrug efflux pump subunit AcrA (membrane-fusion protein)
MIQQGEMAGPGSPIIMIMNTSKVKVVAGVPEKYLRSVKKGQMVKVKFPSLDEERNARVSMIGRMVNPSNRTFDVEVTLSNPGGILKPNLLAMMMINDETIKDAIMIPEELIRSDISGNNYIYTVGKGDEDGAIAQRVNIVMGPTSEGYAVITEGLKGDELIVERGGRGLSAGQHIEVNISSEEQQSGND